MARKSVSDTSVWSTGAPAPPISSQFHVPAPEESHVNLRKFLAEENYALPLKRMDVVIILYSMNF
jgi:hypothetical protein